MTIHIEELSFDCIIGILDFERITPQKVIIDAQIDYDYNDKNFINYADIIGLIEKDMQENKYELLETALQKMAQKIKLNYTHIQNLTLKITKPNIISNARVALSQSF